MHDFEILEIFAAGGYIKQGVNPYTCYKPRKSRGKLLQKPLQIGIRCATERRGSTKYAGRGFARMNADGNPWAHGAREARVRAGTTLA